jgi:hypothetical protein
LLWHVTIVYDIRRYKVSSDGRVMRMSERSAVEFEAFLAAKLWCVAGKRPGFTAIESSLGPLIPVFTSEQALSDFAGAVSWLSTTGGDLLELVPPGFRFLLDPTRDGGGIVLDPQATRRVLAVERLT